MSLWIYEWLKKTQWNTIAWKKKKDSYSNLNMEDVTDENHGHAKRVSKDFEINNLG